jgi:hypothetical protein
MAAVSADEILGEMARIHQEAGLLGMIDTASLASGTILFSHSPLPNWVEIPIAALGRFRVLGVTSVDGLERAIANIVVIKPDSMTDGDFSILAGRLAQPHDIARELTETFATKPEHNPQRTAPFRTGRQCHWVFTGSTYQYVCW